MLSIMESTPNRAQATAALADAEAAQVALARGIAVPSLCFASLFAAVALQIAAAAAGLGTDRPWVLLAGLAGFAGVAAVQLARFRRRNGIWLGGFASRVVLGTAGAASGAYAVALGAAIWAAVEDQWWLVAACALGGGAAYALSGRQWLRRYRAEPAAHARGESAAWLALGAAAAAAGLVLLLVSA
jgi:hypothetical protein